jgi:hypothetical protein
MDRPWVRDEGDQPDVAATVRALERKLLTHPGQQFRPGNPRGVVRAGLCVVRGTLTPALSQRERVRDRRITLTPALSQRERVRDRRITLTPAVSQRERVRDRRITLLADVADRQRRDGPPELVIRRKHPVACFTATGPSMAPAALGGRSQSRGLARPPDRHPAGKWREFDDAIGPRPRGLSAVAGPDPVGGFVPGQHVADARDAAVRAADHGQPVQCKGRAGTVPQQVFETLEVAPHVAVDERDPDACID